MGVPPVLATVLVVAAAVGSQQLGGPRATVTCDSSVWGQGLDAPAPGDRVFAGHVTLPPTRSLQLPAPPAPGEMRFAKHGVLVRAGMPVVFEVPRAERRRYALTFGDVGGRGASEIRFVPCPAASGRWTAWAGGYLARSPQCATLVVRVGLNARRVRLGLGLGQRCV